MIYVRELVHYPDLLPAGKRGRGIRIAFLDSGISEHPDFDGRIVAFRDFVNGKENIYDDTGHGTHVCGIACGDGRSSRGKYAGIAPEADMIIAKILDDKDEGRLSDLLEALRWIRRLHQNTPVHIINISVEMAIDRDPGLQEQLLEMLEELWKLGIIIVCAAGNSGPAPMTINPLASLRQVIAVGCHDGKQSGRFRRNCNDYSARGPGYYEILKPDIVAPGTGIVSCMYLHEGRSRRNMYTMKSGTSMATPIVSGALALLMNHTSERNPEIIKRRLLQTSVDLGENKMKQGWGMLNIENLLTKVY